MVYRRHQNKKNPSRCLRRQPELNNNVYLNNYKATYGPAIPRLTSPDQAALGVKLLWLESEAGFFFWSF